MAEPEEKTIADKVLDETKAIIEPRLPWLTLGRLPSAPTPTADPEPTEPLTGLARIRKRGLPDYSSYITPELSTESDVIRGKGFDSDIDPNFLNNRKDEENPFTKIIRGIRESDIYEEIVDPQHDWGKVAGGKLHGEFECCLLCLYFLI